MCIRDRNQDLFKEMLKEKGLKVTSQRLLVLEMMAEHPGEHLTAEQIYDLVRVQYPEIGLATIYRTVQVLVELHLIDKVSFDDGFARYELGEFDGAKKHQDVYKRQDKYNSLTYDVCPH